MPFKDRFLLHEIHPAKLATDIIAALLAIYLYWEHLLLWGLLMTLVPPVIASSLVIRFADLRYLKTSRLGRYVQRYMTTSLSIVRIIANFIMLTGAWYHNVFVIIFGVLVILSCWAWGLLLERFSL
jgi:hypothetical protein